MTAVRRTTISRALGLSQIAALAALAYVPFLRSPGALSSDSKQYLYLDPGRFLARVPYLWDRRVGAGTVSHQHIGYLFPMGPYYWAADRLGLSDVYAQRFWLGSISLLAALGTRWLLHNLGAGRMGAFVGAVVYMLAPYQLAFTARISVLLLPWAALPWLVLLVVRGTDDRSLRWPAAFALIAMTAGSVNASALVLALLAPALVVVWRVATRRTWRAPWTFAWRSAALGIVTSLWWLDGLRIQGRYGLPVLQLTENVRTVSQSSTPSDILRGLGNWFFYGREPSTAFTLPQAAPYLDNRLVVYTSFAIPALAVLAALVTVWRYRSLFVLFVVVGTIVGVGAYPYDDPSGYGRLWRAAAERFAGFTALRNSPRVGPVIVLGSVALIAAGLGALARSDATRRFALPAAVVVVVVAFGAFAPVWRHGYFAPPVARPAAVPGYWTQLAASLGRDPATTRVLEIPGASFAIYRWGNTVEPITPGLTDRPYLAREVLPYGTEGTVNLLDAFDRRLQLGTFEPAALAPIARLFAAGTVVVRNDLAYDRLGGPRPQAVWAALTQPLAPGLTGERDFGAPTAVVDRIDPAMYARTTPKGATVPVARFDVQGARTIVATARADGSTVVVGDGDGIVDAAAAGLVDGRGLVLELAALTDAQLRDALQRGGDVVLTDTNRRRYRNFFSSIANTAGPTEQAGQSQKDPNGYTYRPDLFPRGGDAERSVVEQSGGQASANRDGGSDRPEDRAAVAFDGDVRTAWRVNAVDVRGARVTLRPAQPERLAAVNLVQSLAWPRQRTITAVRVVVNDTALDVRLTPASLTAAGQTVRFLPQFVNRLSVEIRATSSPTVPALFANPVGFAEIRVGATRVRETVRLPDALAMRAGALVRGRPLAVVLSRLRIDPTLLNRNDEELNLDRAFTLPDDRTFTLGGTARLDTNAPDPQLDTVLGTRAPGVTFSASSHLQGDAASRASRAFDADPATAWTSAFAGQPGQWIQAELASPASVERVRVAFVRDTKHQLPTRVGVEIDGRRVVTRAVALTPSTRDGATQVVVLDVPRTTGRTVRIVVDAVRRSVFSPADPLIPVAITNVDLGRRIAATTGVVDARCRRDLVRVDGAPVAVSLAPTGRRDGFTVKGCGGSLVLRAGRHTVTSARGLDGGLDIDRLVLTSAPSAAAPVTGRGGEPAPAPATVTVTRNGRDRVGMRVTSDGSPFWLVLGESASPGWRPSSGAAAFGPATMVDGYANGWLVTPRRAGTFAVDLRWTPQRSVWISLAASALGIAFCIGALARARPRRSNPVASAPVLAPAWWRDGSAARLAAVPTALLAVAALVTGSLFTRPWIGVVLAVSAVVLARVPAARVAIVVAAPLLILVTRASTRTEFVWISLGWVVIDVVVAAHAAPPATASARPGEAS